jgi:hypothetical protein
MLVFYILGEINIMCALLFLLMASLALLVTAFSDTPFGEGILGQTYVRYLILLSNIIPVIMAILSYC